MEPANISFQRRTLGSLLRFADRTLRARVYARLADAGFPDLRPAHSSLLRNMAGGGSRITELAAAAQMTKQSMGYLADGLAAAGYVTLEPDPTDGRAKRVQLTDKGRAAGDTLVRLSAEVEQEFAASIGAAEMARLRGLLERLANRLIEGG
jgi:DNA-binding MarR family transcriptional regulator